ncbi:hypothetical protein ANCCAN_18948 [Ancylostoma caninum]|uniref:G-protein coupled receptors family 1 profile domain-containing protein n=1 Tax=Ancylostoma caninum TaxID=29170 RepID=A0A368FSR2_ANCCA|nr:hypothetical protein ANCCAN_18948 [Ancylostoma caninum]
MVSSLCRTANAVTPGFFDYISLLRISCILISAVIYMFVVAKLRKQSAKMGTTQAPGFASSQLRGIRRCTVTVGLSVANAVMFLLIPDIIKYFELFDKSLGFIIILYSLSMTNVDLNVLIFVSRHKEIRRIIQQRLFVLLQRKASTTPKMKSDLICKVAPSGKKLESGQRRMRKLSGHDELKK